MTAPDSELTEASFRRFVAARWTSLTRYAFLLTGDHQSAEDVVQTALEKCWQRWGSIRLDAPEPYVRAAIANTAASRHRRRRLPAAGERTGRAGRRTARCHRPPGCG